LDEQTRRKLKEQLFKEIQSQKLGIVARREIDYARTVPSGSLAIDLALDGGWQCGAWHVLWGHPGCGKTTVCILSARERIRHGGRVAWFDTENAVVRERLEQYDVNPDDIDFFGGSGEEIQDMIEAILHAKISGSPAPFCYDLIVVDSVGNTAFQAELEAEAGDNHVAIGARKWSVFFRTKAELLRQAGIPVLLTNHLHEGLGKYEQDRMSGGVKLMYNSHNVFKFRSPEYHRSGSSVLGVTFNAFLWRSRFVPADPKGIGANTFKLRVDFDPALGIAEVNTAAELGRVAIALGVLTKANGEPTLDGKSKYYKGELLSEKIEGIPDALAENPELFQSIHADVRQKFDQKLLSKQKNHGMISEAIVEE